jgi:DNA polymerase
MVSIPRGEDAGEAEPSKNPPACHRRRGGHRAARGSGPIAFDPHCARCPALAANRRQVVPGYGLRPAPIAWLGEAPGRHGADVTGVPFTRDRSGRRLQDLFRRLGLSAADYPAVTAPLLATFVTNVIRCNPPANRAPTTTEIANCRPFLRAELARVRPAVLVTLGLHATRAAAAEFLGREVERIGALHAEPLPVPGRRWPRILVPSRHPARVSGTDWARLERAVALLLAADP